jgi:hypothetical protein
MRWEVPLAPLLRNPFARRRYGRRWCCSRRGTDVCAQWFSLARHPDPVALVGRGAWNWCGTPLLFPLPIEWGEGARQGGRGALGGLTSFPRARTEAASDEGRSWCRRSPPVRDALQWSGGRADRGFRTSYGRSAAARFRAGLGTGRLNQQSQINELPTSGLASVNCQRVAPRLQSQLNLNFDTQPSFRKVSQRDLRISQQISASPPPKPPKRL